MKIRNKANGGLAEVDDAYGARLIAAGGWAAVEDPKPVVKTRVRKAPVVEVQPEEAPATEE